MCKCHHVENVFRIKLHYFKKIYFLKILELTDEVSLNKINGANRFCLVNVCAKSYLKNVLLITHWFWQTKQRKRFKLWKCYGSNWFVKCVERIRLKRDFNSTYTVFKKFIFTKFKTQQSSWFEQSKRCESHLFGECVWKIIINKCFTRY